MARTASDGGSNLPWLFNLRSSRYFIIITLAIAFFFDTFYYGLIIPILPQLLHERVNIGDDTAQLWTTILIAIYCVSQIMIAPVVGYLADRWDNRRVPLIAGLLALGGSTALFAFARNIALLVVGRFLQGASAGVVWAVGLALLVDTVGSTEMAQSMSWSTVSMSIGLTSGPLIGGIIYRRAGHYAVFIVAIAILVVDLVLRLMIIEKKDAEKILSSKAEADDSTSHEGSNPTSTSNGRAPDAESQVQSETSPLLAQQSRESIGNKNRPSALWSLLSSVELVIGLWAIMIGVMVQTSLETVLPLYTEKVFGWDSESSGLAFLALTIPAFTGPIAGYLTDRYGARINTIGGLIVIGICYPCLALVTYKSTGIIVLLCVLLFLIGIGVSFVNVAQVSTVAGFAERLEEETPGIFGSAGATAQSCALVNMSFAVAGIVGPAISGALRQYYGWWTMSIVMGVIALVSILPMFRLTK